MTKPTARCRDQTGQVQDAQKDHRSVPTLDIEFRSSALAPMGPDYTATTGPRNTRLAPARPGPSISHHSCSLATNQNNISAPVTTRLPLSSSIEGSPSRVNPLIGR